MVPPKPKPPSKLVEKADSLKVGVGPESAQVHALEIGDAALVQRLAAAPPEIVDLVMRIGFRIDEWRREFHHRLTVDEAKQQRDDLQKRAAEKPSRTSRRNAKKADRQFRFEHAFEIWREAVKLLADGHGMAAIARAHEAEAWAPVKESSDALAEWLLAADSARAQDRDPTDAQDEIARKFDDLKRKTGSAKAAMEKLANSVRVRESISQGAARKRITRALKAVKK